MSALRVSDKQRNISEKSLANLRPFKKGQSGNPAGRPKCTTLSEALRRALEAPADRDRNGRTNAEVLAVKLIDKARKGNVQAFAQIADRTAK